jgi:hypothetical protein
MGKRRTQSTRLLKWKAGRKSSANGAKGRQHLTTYYLETDTECHLDQDLKKIQDKLLEASLTIVNLAIKTQTSLTRWKRVNNIIILKKKDARSLKYFRNIHIYEADWNAIMGIK